MLGQGCLLGEPDFCAGADGVVGVVGVDGVVGVVGVAAVELEPLAAPDVPAPVVVPVVPVVAGAAAAPAIPAAAPPVASAPATIVAPSIFEIFIGLNLLGSGLAECADPSCAPRLRTPPRAPK